MAFRKTQGRSVFVQPTGMPDLSGFQSLASSFENIADIVFDIGTDIRSEKLNDLIIEAEKEGVTAGSTYDKEDNLVPLTNLSVSDSIDSKVIGAREKKALKKAYTDSAIKTYTANISNEAYLSASDILAKNPNNPEAIRGGLDGFIKALDDANLPLNVKQAVLPSITQHFVSAESQANAGMISLSRKNTEQTLLENIRIVSEQLSAISAKGETTNPAEMAGTRKMVQELTEDLEGSFDALKSIDYTDAEIEKLKSGIVMDQITASSQAHVARSYEINGLSQTLEMIRETRKKFVDNPKIDGNVVADTMIQELNRLKNTRAAFKQETSERQSTNYGQALFDIEMGNLNDINQILKLDINVPQRTVAIQMLKNKQQAIKNGEAAIAKATQDARNEEFNMLMIPFKNEFSNPDEREENAEAIKIMFQKGYINANKFAEFQSKSNEFFIREIKENADVEIAKLENAMRTFSVTLESLQFVTPDLEKIGFIGTGPTASYTRKSWAKRLDKYSNDLATERAKLSEIIQARNDLIAGNANARQRDLVASQDAYKLQEDSQGLTLFSLDEEIQEANFNLVTAFTAQYAVLHPEVKKSLQGLDNPSIEEDVFQSKIQLYYKIRNTLSNAITLSGVTDLGMGALHAESILNRDGVTPLDFEMAAVLGMSKFQDIKQSDTTNPQRRLAGIDVPSLLEENFGSAVSKEQLLPFITRMFTGGKKEVTERENRILKNFFEQAPDFKGDYSDVFIGDERMLKAMELSLANKISLGVVDPKTPASVRSGIRQSIIEISEDVGLNVDSEGNGYFSFSPWHAQASVEIGDVPLGMSTGDAVFEDIKFRLLKPESALPTELKELIESGDAIISLEANSGYGINQTYTVQVENPDTFRVYNVIADYKFDFSTSHLNEVYKLALERVKNKTIKTFMDNYAFVKKGQIKSRIQAIIGDLNNDATWSSFDQKENKYVALMELLQSINSSINPFADIDADKEVDARDVAVLRDLLAGKLSQEEYKDELKRIYGNK
tara:strand:+ start:1219 stop:4251 length:3033 start_codon:yes stop_codon:yes gene_type:complete